MASRAVLRQISRVDFSNGSDLWAAVLWSGIGGGYLLYGWRQKSAIPLAGGAAMTLACFLPALWMSLVGVAVMFGVWWLLKEGY